MHLTSVTLHFTLDPNSTSPHSLSSSTLAPRSSSALIRTWFLMALYSKHTLLGSSWITLIIAFSILIVPTLNMAQHQDCFSPNGSVLRGFGLCDPSNSTSVCCKLKEACMENGLCSTPYGFLYRGGCTDRSFKSGFCPTKCIDSELWNKEHLNFFSHWSQLLFLDFNRPWVNACQKSANVSGAYCCDNDNSGDCCNNADSTFVLGALVTSVSIVTESITRNYTISSSSTISSSFTNTMPASTSTSNASPSTTSSSSGVKFGVGAGVGVGALVTIALALLWSLWRRSGARTLIDQCEAVRRWCDLVSSMRLDMGILAATIENGQHQRDASKQFLVIRYHLIGRMLLWYMRLYGMGFKTMISVGTMSSRLNPSFRVSVELCAVSPWLSRTCAANLGVSELWCRATLPIVEIV